MKHPLSLNFKVLEQYDFTKTACDEVIFFEWLILKRTSFGNERFFYQQNKLSTEIGIKRRRLETLKGDFITSYGLAVEKGGFNNVTYFTVSDEVIKMFVRDKVKKDFQKDLENRLLKFEFKNSETLTQSEIIDIESFLEELQEIYNDRRILKNKTDDKRVLNVTSLAVNRKTKIQLNELLKCYTNDTIQNSFIAFCDAQVEGKDPTYHMMNNFTSYDKVDEKFGVFEYYLEVFNRSYSREKR